jgi:pimeloyl-ACP methyl ester carboxylesterase
VLHSLSETRFVESFDGVAIAWREIGAGRPLLLVHGYFAEARANWIRPGHAATLAELGVRVIMPDLRGHGESDKPHLAEAYPPDVLERDMHALVTALTLHDYDLAGYSLGARVVVRMLATGATPRRVILGGTGLEGIIASERRASLFRAVLDGLGRHPAGSKEWLIEGFLRANNSDTVAMRHVVETITSTPVELLSTFEMPVLVICGDADCENGSPVDLARALSNGRYLEISGGHLEAATRPELAAAIGAFVTG